MDSRFLPSNVKRLKDYKNNSTYLAEEIPKMLDDSRKVANLMDAILGNTKPKRVK